MLVYGWGIERSWQLEDISMKIYRKFEFLNRKIFKLSMIHPFWSYFISFSYFFSLIASQWNGLDEFLYVCICVLIYIYIHSQAVTQLNLCVRFGVFFFLFLVHITVIPEKLNTYKYKCNHINCNSVPDTANMCTAHKWNSLVWFG